MKNFTKSLKSLLFNLRLMYVSRSCSIAGFYNCFCCGRIIKKSDLLNSNNVLWVNLKFKDKHSIKRSPHHLYCKKM